MSKDKLLYLEGLRGIASYGVFLVHFLDGYWENGLAWVKFKQYFNIYVALFFILSGRILTVSSLRSRNIGSIAVSFCKRPLRLGLPLVALTALNSWVQKLRHDLSYSFLQTYFQPIHFMVYNGDVKDPIPGVAWTMPIEFMGSMIVYILTLIVLYFDSKRAIFVIFCITIGFTVFTHTWISHFLMGLMIAVYKDGLSYLSVKDGSRIWSKAIMFKTTLCFLVFFLCFDSPIGIGKDFAVFLRTIQKGTLGVDEYYWQPSLNVFIISSTIMLVLETTPMLQRFLSNWFFLYLARISFMLYLSHGFLYCNPTTKKYWIQATPSFLHEHTGGRLLYTFSVSFVAFLSSDFLTIWVDGIAQDLANFFVFTVLNDSWSLSSILSSWTNWPFIIYRYLKSKVCETVSVYSGYCRWTRPRL